VRQFRRQSRGWVGRAQVRPSTRIFSCHLASGVRCAAPSMSSAHSYIGYSIPFHRPSGRLLDLRLLVLPAPVPPSFSTPPCLLRCVHLRRRPCIVRGELSLCFRGIRVGRNDAPPLCRSRSGGRRKRVDIGPRPHDGPPHRAWWRGAVGWFRPKLLPRRGSRGPGQCDFVRTAVGGLLGQIPVDGLVPPVLAGGVPRILSVSLHASSTGRRTTSAAALCRRRVTYSPIVLRRAAASTSSLFGYRQVSPRCSGIMPVIRRAARSLADHATLGVCMIG
jgi:hypothetical protein